MRVLAFLLFSCACAAKVEIGDAEGQTGRFLAASSRLGVSGSSGSEADTEYARETQSPMVWLNLHKSSLNLKSSLPGVAYDDYLSQRLGDPHSA